MGLDKEALSIKINDTLEQLRPFLVADGGDMELVEITDEGVARVRLLGACSGVAFSAPFFQPRPEQNPNKTRTKPKQMLSW